MRFFSYSSVQNHNHLKRVVDLLILHLFVLISSITGMEEVEYPKHSLAFSEQIAENSLSGMKTIRQLDKSAELLSQILDKKIQSLNLVQKPSAREARSHEINKIRASLDVIASKKVEIAMRLYDFLDVNVKFIDAEMTTIERALEAGGHSLPPEQPRLVRAVSSENAEPVKKKRGRPRSNSLTEDNSSTVADIIDSNIEIEPVYCICKRVAFGEMIACDNEDCPIEWYHYSCVSLTRKPRNTWICSLCTKKMKK